jgi:hypothetical protein
VVTPAQPAAVIALRLPQALNHNASTGRIKIVSIILLFMFGLMTFDFNQPIPKLENKHTVKKIFRVFDKNLFNRVVSPGIKGITP